MEVWHVRHGERMDEASGPIRSSWAGSAAFQEGRSYDSPLTQHGHFQASVAGLHLSMLQQSNQAGATGDGEGCSLSFDRVYTSPLIRAVQTAACVSRALGGLSLQVVPGLCACTAGLRRTGYKQAILMADADIVDIFPEVKLITRDPSAPTSFCGAQEWLATRPFRRVLAVGHREGTKAMAGRLVPTPHCCIAIFKVDATKSFELYDLLSHKGKSLGAAPSPYARRKKRQTNVPLDRPEDAEKNSRENGGLQELSSDMLALDLEPRQPSDARRTRAVPSPAVTTADKEPPSQAHGITHMTPSTRVPGGADNSTVFISPDFLQAIWLGGLEWARRELAGTASSSAHRESRIAKPKPGNGVGVKGPNLTVRRLSRRSSSASVDDNKAKGSTAPSTTAAPGRTQSGKNTPGINAGNGGAGVGPLPPIARCSPHDTATNESASGDHAKGRTASKGKPAARACAGRGFRAAPLARRSMAQKSRYAGILGVPVDTLTGPSGVLCYLHPTELCTMQSTCKTMATATASEHIWFQLYSRLPQKIRAAVKQNNPPINVVPPTTTAAKRHAKALFKEAVAHTSVLRWAKTARNTAAVRRRLGAIHSLRGSVDALKIDLGVRLSGSPAKLMASRGDKAEAWVSNPSVLSEPSTRNGVRFFSFSSSLKVEVPGSLAVSHLESLSVGYLWPDAWLPRVAVLKKDGPLFGREARLVGKSADKFVSLYDIVERFDRSHDGSTPVSSPPPPRACILLGMLEGGRQGDQGFGFLTVHLPHELLLDATRGPLTAGNPSSGRRSKSYGDDSAGDRHSLEPFHVALGLRTAGVPVWEAASLSVAGDLCPRTIPAREGHRRCTGCSHDETAVVCVELLKAEGDAAGGLFRAEACRLTAGPGLPYSSSGGLSGVIEDVLLADLSLSDANGDSMWAFTMPIVFQTSASTAAASPGGGNDDSGVIDMGRKEVREERRRGVVGECGVGKVVVELSLVESDEDEDPVGRADGEQRRRRCPAGHAWVVRAARVELEVGFIDAWFGTKHGRA